MSMWKQLFSEAPPGAMEQLLSPKRKLFYALFAFTPGTVLGLYLNSVKNDMERENEALRLQHIEEELQGEVEREQKDVLLMNMIQDLRARIQSLEREATDQHTARTVTDSDSDKRSSNTAAAAATTSASAVKTQAPAATAEWDQQRDAFLTIPVHAAVTQDAASGISTRVKQRERDLLRDDVRAFKAARAATAAATTDS